MLDEKSRKLFAGEQLVSNEINEAVLTGDLLSLGSLADTRRRQLHGERTTFVRVYEVELVELHTSELEIPQTAGEVRIVGEIQSGDHAVSATKQVVSLSGGIPVSGFALDRLAELCRWDVSELVDLLVQLKQAGLSLLAEVRVNHMQEPIYFEAASESGFEIGCATVDTLTADGGVNLIRKVVSWGNAAKLVHAFAPLPVSLGPEPTTGYADVRQVALARVLVENINSIQVDWRLYGPKLAQVALSFGADDIDRVSPLENIELGWRRTPLEEIRRNVSASGLVPVQRNGRFEILESNE
jgi:hypothetical protein